MVKEMIFSYEEIPSLLVILHFIDKRRKTACFVNSFKLYNITKKTNKPFNKGANLHLITLF